MHVSASEWQVLSPLIDQALDLTAPERVQWLATQSHLGAELRGKLAAILRDRDAPETHQFMETLQLPRDSTLPPSRLQEAQAASPQAEDLVGPYTLLRVIGHGGMGEVWLARRSDGAFQRDVALKLPNTDHAPQRMRERLERERDVLATLEHSNIARFYDAGVSADDQPYIAMEYIDGESLTAYASARNLDLRDRCKLMLQVLAAVQYAHQRLVVHRDLKPSNILVRANRQAALLDFGIAKVLDEATGQGAESELTRDSGRALTIAYAAPEQILGLPVSTATDVFACGILFYELLSGHRPFAEHEGTLGAMIGAHDAPIKRMPSIKRRAISRDLNAIVSLALRREPNERYESAAAFADDIKRFLNDETVRAVHGARWYAFSKFVKRHRGAWLIGAASTLALIGLGIYAAYQYALNQRMRVQAETVARVMSGVISGMSPTNSDNQLVHPKELLDRSVNSLGERAFESVLALKFSDLYQTIGEYDSAIRLVDRSLGARQNSGDHNASVRLLASKANAFLGLKQVSEAQQAMAKARADLGAHAWQVSDTSRVTLFLTEGRVAVARDALDEADSAYGEARHQMERRGDNDDDMLTLAIDGQATVARRRDRFARAVELLADANAAALRYGEISAPLRLGRILTDGQLQMELGDPVAAVRLFDAFYEDAKVRYSASHITRVYGGLMLAKALYQSGERERAGTILDGLASGTRLGPPYLSVRPGPARHALFFRSVIGSRWDVMLDYWQVRLLVPPTDDRFPFDEDLQAKELLALEATPNDWMSGIANRTKFGWMAAPTDRAKLALGVAKRQVIRIQSVGVEKWLDVAESAFHTNVTGERLALAEAWVIRAITRMRERDFASSKDLLTRAHHVYQTVLGDANPRTLAINVYLALAEAGASDRTASVSLPVVPALSRLQESYSAKRMLEPLSAWITTNRDTPNWAELPLFSP